jgi:hypothetical protein
MLEQIKLVRLQSGEDIIAVYVEDPESEMVQLINPMIVFFKKLASGNSLLMVSPWLPVEIVENDSATIYTSDILTVVDPKQNVIDYYYKTLLELQKYKEEEQSSESILDWGDEDEDEESLSEEEIKEALEELKTNKRLLH